MPRVGFVLDYNRMGKFRLTDDEQFGVSLGGMSGKTDEVDTGGDEVPVLV